MHSDNLRRRRWGFYILKLCVRIVCLTLLTICCIMLLFYGGIVVHYCCSGKFDNRIASLRDLLGYIFSSDEKRVSWVFLPEGSGIENTRRSYVAEFCPRLARRHDVYFFCNELGPFDENCLEKMMKGVVLQIVVSHVQTGAIYDLRTLRVSTNRNKPALIYNFSTADLPWKYTDKLRIMITPTIVSRWHKEIDVEMCKIELLVSEGVPFY